jgi:hypothetical protein
MISDSASILFLGIRSLELSFLPPYTSKNFPFLNKVAEWSRRGIGKISSFGTIFLNYA